MHRFFDTAMTQWEQRQGSLHVYALPDDALRSALARFLTVVDAEPACAVVESPWLHATVQRLPWYVDRLSADGAARLVEALRSSLADLPAFDVRLGPPTVDEFGVHLAGEPSSAWDDLVGAVVAASVEALGDDPPNPESPFGPHVSLGYAVADGDGPALQARLDAVGETGPLVLAIDAVELLPVAMDPTAGTFTWPVSGPRLRLAAR